MNHFEFGEFQISRIEEIVDCVDAKFLIPSLLAEVLDENADWLVPNHYTRETNQLAMFIQFHR